mmetsp:Transcript_25907/g.35965  ORF Transcript_25907/g.35965 Transcript_25907/m.35965 type:complete len:214 (+) Transcript_25907:2045-2686(+)
MLVVVMSLDVLFWLLQLLERVILHILEGNNVMFQDANLMLFQEQQHVHSTNVEYKCVGNLERPRVVFVYFMDVMLLVVKLIHNKGAVSVLNIIGGVNYLLALRVRSIQEISLTLEDKNVMSMGVKITLFLEGQLVPNTNAEHVANQPRQVVDFVLNMAALLLIVRTRLSLELTSVKIMDKAVKSSLAQAEWGDKYQEETSNPRVLTQEGVTTQ